MSDASPPLNATDLSNMAALNALPSKYEAAGLPRLYPQEVVLGPFACGAHASLGGEALNEGVWCFLQPFEGMQGCTYVAFMGPTEVAQGNCPAGQIDPFGFFIDGQAVTDALNGVFVFDLYARISQPGSNQEEETERLTLTREPGQAEPNATGADVLCSRCQSALENEQGAGGAENGSGAGPKAPEALSFGGPHQQTVAAGYIIAEGRAPNKPTSSAGATYTRQAEHGVAPYRYESSNTGVAVVDQNGRVVAAGNGSAEIHAIDSVGTRASYTITFSGVKLVRLERSATWPGPEGNPIRPEYATNRTQMMQFWLQYKDEAPGKSVPQILGWPDTSYWTCENILTGPVAWAVRLNTPQPDFNGFSAHGGTALPALRRIGF